MLNEIWIENKPYQCIWFDEYVMNELFVISKYLEANF